MKMTWCGEPPATCDICDAELTNIFIDGRTRMGPWGCLCITCHASHGVGLGTGRGQKYIKQGDDFIKIEG
jgi:hypothetical protein